MLHGLSLLRIVGLAFVAGMSWEFGSQAGSFLYGCMWWVKNTAASKIHR